MKLKLAAQSVVILILCLGACSQAQSKSANRIPKGARVFIASMSDDFDTYLKAAIEKKKVPVQVVTDKTQAQYQITGSSDTQKAGVAKKVLALDWRSTEEASIQVANIESGEVVFAYAVHLQSSNHGKKSSAEACAKHLRDKAF